MPQKYAPLWTLETTLLGPLYGSYVLTYTICYNFSDPINENWGSLSSSVVCNVNEQVKIILLRLLLIHGGSKLNSPVHWMYWLCTPTSPPRLNAHYIVAIWLFRELDNSVPKNGNDKDLTRGVVSQKIILLLLLRRHEREWSKVLQWRMDCLWFNNKTGSKFWEILKQAM